MIGFDGRVESRERGERDVMVSRGKAKGMRWYPGGEFS